MNKGLDLVQRQMIETIDGYPTGNVYIGLTSEELVELEKELKSYEDFKKIMKDYDLKPSNLRQACIVFRMNKDGLKALDILKEHCVKIGGMRGNFEGKNPTNEIIIVLKDLTQEEFELLKGVL